jgi:hypothetical protein
MCVTKMEPTDAGRPGSWGASSSGCVCPTDPCPFRTGPGTSLVRHNPVAGQFRNRGTARTRLRRGGDVGEVLLAISTVPGAMVVLLGLELLERRLLGSTPRAPGEAPTRSASAPRLGDGPHESPPGQTVARTDRGSRAGRAGRPVPAWRHHRAGRGRHGVPRPGPAHRPHRRRKLTDPDPASRPVAAVGPIPWRRASPGTAQPSSPPRPPSPQGEYPPSSTGARGVAGDDRGCWR